MDWQPFFLILGGVLVFAAGGVVGYVLRSAVAARSDGNANEARATAHPQQVDDTTQAIRSVRTVMPRDGLLATPPTIDGVTLRDYLTHHATRRCPHQDDYGRPIHAGTWPCVVEDMYAAAGASPEIAPYFGGVDMADLKRHFLSALVTLTHVGLTVATADRLGHAHEHLRIPPAHFDAVVGVLVDCIASYTTPQVMAHMTPQLSPAVAALRARIADFDEVNA